MWRCCLRRQRVAAEDQLQAQLEELTTENAQLKVELERQTSETRSREVTVSRLKDKLEATRQIAVETQLRQLNELQTLTEENRELKQKLNEIILRQQQAAAADEHRHGIFVSS